MGKDGDRRWIARASATVKRGCRVAAMLACGMVGPGARADGGEAWQVESARHFRVYYQEDASLARRVAHAADRAYARIMHDLGFRKYGDFWTWDKRAKVYIYPTFTRFHAMTGAPRWVRAKAAYERKAIFVVASDDALLAATLPHELAHLVFRDFLGFGDKAPAWLHEGIAQRQEVGEAEGARRLVRVAARAGRLISLAELTALRVRDAAARGKAPLFYAQAEGVVSFMIERYGAIRFRAFCGRLRDGKSLEDALRLTYSDTIHSIEALEREWRQTLR